MTRERTDFAKVLSELREAGLNDYRMSEVTGIDRTTLSKLRAGDRKSINYDDGVQIMKIYNREFEK